MPHRLGVSRMDSEQTSSFIARYLFLLHIGVSQSGSDPRILIESGIKMQKKAGRAHCPTGYTS